MQILYNEDRTLIEIDVFPLL